MTADGQTYFHNPSTGATQWDPPLTAAAANAASAAAAGGAAGGAGGGGRAGGVLERLSRAKADLQGKESSLIELRKQQQVDQHQLGVAQHMQQQLAYQFNAGGAPQVQMQATNLDNQVNTLTAGLAFQKEQWLATEAALGPARKELEELEAHAVTFREVSIGEEAARGRCA
jgi:hypothetical protein